MKHATRRRAIQRIPAVSIALLWSFGLALTHAPIEAQLTRPPVAGAPNAAPAQPPVPEVVAEVNGEKITRDQLAQACLREHGQEILERLVNKHLIMIECERVGITVTTAEVQEEIRKMAGRFNLPVEDWLSMLQRERNIDPDQYSNEIIWPTLALRKLAADRLTVSNEEIQQAFQTKYGPAVQVRMIVCNTSEHALSVVARVKADPDSFGTVAKNESVDVPSAASHGLIYPIRRGAGPKAIEDAVFALKESEISEPVQIANQFFVFKCEKHYPAMEVAVTPQLLANIAAEIRDGKLRSVADDIFKKLQQEARVENVMNDPAKAAQMPGVAAMVNGRAVSLAQLTQVCMERHGKTVLLDLIHRRLLAQECAKRNLVITQQDIDEEIRRAAEMMLPPAEDGAPDIPRWIELVTTEQGVTPDVYVSNTVWPSVALKKLVGDTIQISEEDMRKGFESNYGERVRVLAIVVGTPRQAQEVFQKARANPTPANFRALAAEYSVEAASRALGGEVPPIQRHSGQPLLEAEAFRLTEGEVSAPVQVDMDRFVILYCLGRTEPVEVTMEEARQFIYEDIHEKKLRMEMLGYFDRLIGSAAIDNYLTGKSQSPQRSQTGTTARAGSVANPLR